MSDHSGRRCFVALDQLSIQRSFFKKVYGKEEASPYEFDMVINFDYIRKPQWAADIVEKAFQTKFGDKIASGQR